MSDLTLTKIRLRNRRWEGRLTGAPAAPHAPTSASPISTSRSRRSN